MAIHLPPQETPKEGIAAVLTGDVVSSARLRLEQPLPDILGAAFARVAAKQGSVLRPFEIFRGDSFQGVMAPREALFGAIVIRASLRATRCNHNQTPDARIAIGIGTIDAPHERIPESDGEAFRLSGRALDGLANAKGGGRLGISTCWPSVQEEIETIGEMLDSIILRWRRPSAEVMSLILTDESITQTIIASQLKISQPAVSVRMTTAQAHLVQKLITRFETLVAERSLK